MSVAERIAERIAQLTSIRTAIRTALTAKGVTDAGNHNYADFAEDIGSIETGGGLPDKGFVLENYDSDGYPTTCRFVGNWTEIPSGFFSNSSSGSTMNYIKRIKHLSFPEGVTKINDSTFNYWTWLETITFPSTLTSLGLLTYLTGVTEVVYPSNVAFTSQQQARGWSGLKRVIFLGGAVTRFSTSFDGDTSVELYDFSHFQTVPTLSGASALGHASGCVIKVPQSLLTQWQAATNWADLTDVVWQGV